MTTRQFLERLKALDVRIWLDGDKLRVNAPQGALTSDLRIELGKRKPEIVIFLRAGSAIHTSLVPVQPHGSRPPFFGIPGHNGDVYCYVRLAHHLGDDQPFFALQPPGVEGERAPLVKIPDLAAYYVSAIRDFVPRGPYLMGGYCLGGCVAFEVARQLHAIGEDVRLLVLFDSPFPSAHRFHNKVWLVCRYLLHRIPQHLRELQGLDMTEWFGYARNKVGGALRRLRPESRSVVQGGDGGAEFKEAVGLATTRAARDYRPGIYPGHVHFFAASETSLKRNYGLELDWGPLAAGGLTFHVGPEGCTGTDMLLEPFVPFFADRLRECLDAAGRAKVGA